MMSQQAIPKLSQLLIQCRSVQHDYVPAFTVKGLIDNFVEGIRKSGGLYLSVFRAPQVVVRVRVPLATTAMAWGCAAISAAISSSPSLVASCCGVWPSLFL